MTLNDLFRLAFYASYSDTLKYMEDWCDAVPDVLWSSNEPCINKEDGSDHIEILSFPAEINDVKAYLDEKNPAPVGAGNGNKK